MKGGQLDQDLQGPQQWSWEEMLALLNPAAPGQRSTQLDFVMNKWHVPKLNDSGEQSIDCPIN